ncbi:hypothetical protein [Flavobacterium sp. PL002]|uniref:hypothetical protein n=1 Tax=Flavobacterium sp. PL002 TaxID=1897058 RepID=UPI001787D077|nr:hypothetical protein [Flavobacterium sp. PL002]MBE0393767.1 hypothetical protein [Flavobacterium sp. PL002]
MKNIKYILLFLLLFSCKEKQSDLTLSQPEIEINSTKDSLININYTQIPINCEGKQFAPTNCENKEKSFFCKFTLDNNKSSVEFNYKSKIFIHSFTETPFELGFNSYLFENKSNMILILDSFLEYGHTFYVYQLDNDKDIVKFIGSKNFDAKIDKNEIELKYNFDISENDETLILKLGSGYDEMNFNLSNSSVLPIKDINLSNVDSKIESKWIGIYKGSFLQFKEEYNDPRSWATVYINLNKDSLTYELHSLKEENSILEIIDRETNSLTLKMENGNTLKISNNNNSGKYTLEGSQIAILIDKKSILDLTKE